MRGISISNLAWSNDDDSEALALAATTGFTGIELMPAKAFGSWSVPEHTIDAYRRKVADAGLEIAALQGITFGIEGIHLFSSPEHRRRLADQMKRVADIAALLGAGACVFGAPGLRDPGKMSEKEALDIAASTFSDIALIFDACGTVLCFEPIPKSYGCRFVNTTTEACDLVRLVDHSAFRTQIDTGTIFANREPLASLVAAMPLAGHLHVSEPNLVPLGTLESDHGSVATVLADQKWNGWRSVEMKPSEDWRGSIGRAGKMMKAIYMADA
jgi:D-psicose/D-tagatose/L-ribulose 3-epimerase